MGNRYEIMKSMHTIICAMNNEDAYSSWIYIVPDEASDDDLMDIATDDELFADACAAFKSAMQEYGADRFYIDKWSGNPSFQIKEDMNMKYIAYGSNMVQEQMAHRCPNARLLGTGWLPNHRLEFYLHATVEKTRSKEARVPVAVWEIDEADERNLDRYEGVPTYYIKRHAKVQMRDGSEIEGLIYIMKAIRPYPPEKTYYNGIFHAYNRLGFGSEIETVLEPALRRTFRQGIKSRFYLD